MQQLGQRPDPVAHGTNDQVPRLELVEAPGTSGKTCKRPVTTSERRRKNAAGKGPMPALRWPASRYYVRWKLFSLFGSKPPSIPHPPW